MATAAEVLAELEALGSDSHREGMARYAITCEKAYGVPVGQLRALAKRLGRDHALAQALWGGLAQASSVGGFCHNVSVHRLRSCRCPVSDFNFPDPRSSG